MRLRFFFVLSSAVLLAATAPPLPWAFPGAGSQETRSHGNDPLHLPGSKKSYVKSSLDDMTHAMDRFPQSHPVPPSIVLNGSASVAACGYCHLPDGSGRIENADLRGLPVDYIEEQVQAFASGTRRSADPGFVPARYMAAVARALRPADLRAAAEYFAALDPVSHTRVKEAARVPRATEQSFVYRCDPSASEPLGLRIVEGPDDFRAYELHDPRVRATAWVPPGSISRGRAIAMRGTSQIPACQGCHKAEMLGIGGASPTYIARQLAGFRAKVRNDPSAAPMQAAAAALTDAQIVDIAAYVGAHRPWTHAQMAKAMVGDH